MKELKKLKKKLANMALDYIEKHEGKSNRKQHEALEEIKEVRINVEFNQSMKILQDVVEGSTFYINDFSRSLFSKEYNDGIDVECKYCKGWKRKNKKILNEHVT